MSAVSGGASGDLEDQTELPTTQVGDNVPGVGLGTRQQGVVQYSWETSLRRAPAQVRRDRIADANRALMIAVDQEVGLVERSNAFDLWLQRLDEESSHALGRSIHFRQVLGLLVASVQKRDLVDFSAEALMVFRTVTNILHSPSVAESDTQRAARALNGLAPRIALAVSGHEQPDDGGLTLVDELLAKL